jgi:hypothetical protein
MNRLLLACLWLSIAIVCFIVQPVMAAEEKPPAKPMPAADAPATMPAPEKLPINQPAHKIAGPVALAPGVMINIEPNRDLTDTVSYHDLTELLAEDKNYDWAKNVSFRHEIWSLQFSFKPVRMIWVDIPQPSGLMQRKLIWYMVYSVANSGKVMEPVKAELPYENELADKKKIYEIKSVDKPIHFVPEFLLEGHNRMKPGEGFTKSYPDRVIPVAVAAIQLREGYGQKLHNSVEMNRDIPVGQTVWGVATWEDIDPKIVRFSIYVTGLTNAYRWKDSPNKYKPDESLAKYRKLLRKNLKLNFWRPGDEYFETEDEIRYGIPGEVDYQWVYR